MRLHSRCEEAAVFAEPGDARARCGRRALGFAAVLIGFGTLALAPPLASTSLAQAQDANLIRKVERLQKELNDLQRYVYRGGAPSGGAATSGGDTVPTDVASRMQLQINKMQDQLRSMNGRVEEMQHRIAVLEQRLDRMADDLEIRLQRIEDAVSGVVPAGQTPGQTDAAEEAGADSAALTRIPAPTTPGLPDDASPREQYDFAFDLLKKRDYGSAGAALEAFLEKNPDNALAGNAIYWLGETHYVQKEYKAAAKVFLEGYQKYPTGSKAPDNLLKLGMSLAAYGDTESACKTYTKLLETFPKAPARITKAAKSEQRKLDCK